MKGHLDIKRAPLKVQGKANYDGATVNPKEPAIQAPPPRGKSVPIAPAINKGATGPDGGKRIIQNEAKPAGRDAAIGKSTFRAPRNESRGSVTDCGYTPISMSEGAKGNGRGNGNR